VHLRDHRRHGKNGHAHGDPGKPEHEHELDEAADRKAVPACGRGHGRKNPAWAGNLHQRARWRKKRRRIAVLRLRGGYSWRPHNPKDIPSVKGRFLQSSAVAEVWAPVYGAAPKHLAGWCYQMLQAFIDDSREAKPPIFVLAGYLAPMAAWGAFAKDWQEALDMPPAIPYFKMSKAKALLGAKADERIRLLHAVIERHITAGFSIMVPPDAIKQLWGPKDKFARHPFYCAFSVLIPLLGLNIEEFGFQCDKIELHFDDQMHEKDRMIGAWDWARKNARVESPKIKNILTSTPQFGDDKRLLPLQSADFHAWWMRRRYFERITGAPRRAAPWRSKDTIKYMQIEVSEEQLRQRRFQHILANIKDGFSSEA
jgi:hypothetical protein